MQKPTKVKNLLAGDVILSRGEPVIIGRIKSEGIGYGLDCQDERGNKVLAWWHGDFEVILVSRLKSKICSSL